MSLSKTPPSGGALVWFRDDLRLADNPALDAAVKSGAPVTALYVLDDESTGLRPMGGASRWWLSNALEALAADCKAIGLPFAARRGRAADVVREAIDEAGADSAFWNRRYAAEDREIDAGLKASLREDGLSVESFNGRLLNEPWEVRSKAGGLRARRASGSSAEARPDETGSRPGAERRGDPVVRARTVRARLGAGTARSVGTGRGRREKSAGALP